MLVKLRAAVLLIAGTTLLAARDAAWQPFEYLVGEWEGEGTGAPGEGTGGSTFRFDLDGRVLTRTNWANYPAAEGRPASTHRDQMVIWHESGAAPFRAIYFDNEGHVIHYTVRTSADGAIEFLSDAASGAPQYRMTYRRAGPDNLTLKFEIAPAEKPGDFRTYIVAKAHRKAK